MVAINNKIGVGLFRCFILIFLVVAVGVISVSVVLAEDEPVQNVCCEETLSGFFCQNVPADQCKQSSRQVPTSCESTSFCKPSYCFNSFDGTCSDNTPKVTCEANGGTWSDEFPAQCELGCCVLGDQASFTTLTHCKKLSGSLGLNTNYKKSITTESECILSVAGQEKGACVYEREFEKRCDFTTREDCTNNIDGEFFKDKLCSADELGTICGPTTQASCIPGKDEVYFIDSCGNPANVYDSSKVNNADYWSNYYDKIESCNPGSSNADSGSCGNCNYLLGSICREKRTGAVCVDLNCKGTKEELGGKTKRQHGESWCARDGEEGVGGRFIKNTCNNGEVISDSCADFKQEECIQEDVDLENGNTFSQAACRVNRWRDCVEQTEEDECEDSTARDCEWKSIIGGEVCLPEVSPGLEFWKPQGEADEICSLASIDCIVVFSEDLFGGSDCEQNCHCLDAEWEKERADICSSLGDCGPKANWKGEFGDDRGYEKFVNGIEQYSVDEGFFKKLFRR